MTVGDRPIRRDLNLLHSVGLRLAATTGDRGCKAWKMASMMARLSLGEHAVPEDGDWLPALNGLIDLVQGARRPGACTLYDHW